MPNKKKKGYKHQPPMAKNSSSSRNVRPVVKKQWSEKQMAGTISSITKGHLSGNKAADLHGVPRSTLKDRLNGKVQCGIKPGTVPYLSKEE